MVCDVSNFSGMLSYRHMYKITLRFAVC